MNTFLDNKRELILILCISFFLFFLKWVLSFHFFVSESLTIKVINESFNDGYDYYHYIKSLANLNFDSLYSSSLTTKYFLPIPYGSVVFHSILYKLIGDISFILLEWIAIFLFILIFYSIFKLINFTKNTAILLSVIFYVLPETLLFFNSFGIAELNSFAGNFYNLRFPRPLVANLLFFLFIYILIKSHINNNMFNFRNLFSLAVLFALSLSSFFFLFLNEVITFIIYLLIVYNKKIIPQIKLNFTKVFYALIIFLLIVTPFFFLLFKTNPDYMERMGIINVSISDKIFLLKHYLAKLFHLKLVLVYFFLIFTYFIMKKFNYENLKYIFIFYILFISSIISPLIFVLLSNKIAFLYHFNNTVVVCLVLLILMLLIVNFKFFLNSINLSFNNNYLFVFTIFLILFFYNLNSYRNYINYTNDELRIDRNKIIDLISNNSLIKISNSKILSFDKKIMVWSILKGNQDLNVIDGTYTLRDSSQIEDDLINAFKFLKLSKKDFNIFISNSKIGYRYNNPELKIFFWQKYTANSFYRFNKSNDFDSEVLDFLINSSPFYVHQFALPNFEIIRMLDKFVKNQTIKTNNPDIIIIEKTHTIFNKVIVNNKNYCKKFDGKKLDLYILKKFCV